MLENRLLIISSDSETIVKVQQIAEQRSYGILIEQNIEKIQVDILTFKPTLIILDLNFADLDGISMLNYLHNIQCKIQLIMTGVGDEKLLLAIKHISESKGLKLHKILTKPLSLPDLNNALESVGRGSASGIDARTIVNSMEQDNFIIHYQPKIELKTKRLRGFEALIRLLPPYEHIIYPSEFIPTAEETGLIVPLTHLLVKKVFSDYVKFSNLHPELKFALNLSVQSLADPVFPDEIYKLTKEYGVNPHNICFEITESGVSHQSEVILETITRLRVMGFSLSIDDFGTGYSSIVELHRLPFTELKIDRRFVAELASENSSKIIVSAIIELGHNLGLELVAEGVENKITMDILEQLNCDIMQGYYISKALSIDELELWYKMSINENLIWHMNRDELLNHGSDKK